LFLIAYFFYSDSYSTLATVGILIFQDVLCMKSLVLGIVILEVMIIAIFGNIFALHIQKRWNVEPKYMIFGQLCGYMLLCILGLLGLIPGSPVGMKHPSEAFIFAAMHGMMIGAVQAFSRSLYSDLLIPGKEAEFFALYEVTDKGSSWLGPLVVGMIHQSTSSHHMSFIYLLVMTVLPGALLLSVDYHKGMAAVQKLTARGDDAEGLALSQDPSHQNVLDADAVMELHASGGNGKDLVKMPLGEADVVTVSAAQRNSY